MIKYIKTIFCLFVFATQINVQAQISNTKVAALVEALRLAAPDGNLYSDWQVKPRNIQSWSKRCLGNAITPDEFATNSALARQVLECKIGRLFQKYTSEQDENTSVLQTASWWMSGIPDNYNSSSKLKIYTQVVLKFYQQQLSVNTLSNNDSQTIIKSDISAISAANIASFVEALRLVAPKSGTLYSEWQVKADNIIRWSKPCLGKKITPTEFANEPDTARLILECKMGAILQKEDVNDMSITVRRAAAWWITGNSNDYNKASIKNYTLKVLEFYNNLK
ncbi:MAG: hypothetical protein QM487_10485 [Candidatus Marithrix sp.]